MKKFILLTALGLAASVAGAQNKPFISANAGLGNGGLGAGAQIAGLSVGAGIGQGKAYAEVNRDKDYWKGYDKDSRYGDRYDKRDYYDRKDNGNHYGQYKDRSGYGINANANVGFGKAERTCYRTGFLGLRRVCD